MQMTAILESWSGSGGVVGASLRLSPVYESGHVRVPFRLHQKNAARSGAVRGGVRWGAPRRVCRVLFIDRGERVPTVCDESHFQEGRAAPQPINES